MTQSNFEYLGCVETKQGFYRVYEKRGDLFTPIEFEGRVYFMLLQRKLKTKPEFKRFKIIPESEVTTTAINWNNLKIRIRGARKVLSILIEKEIDPDSHLDFIFASYRSLHGYALIWKQMLNDVSH